MPPRQSSTSSRESGRSCRRPARSRTWPAWTVSTAGARSEARKLRAEMPTPPISAEPLKGSATAHGTTVRPPPETSSRARPWIAPSAARQERQARASASPARCAPGSSRTRAGVAVTETPAIASVAAATSIVTRREETFRSDDPADGLPARLVGRAEADGRGHRRPPRPRAAASGSTMPAPCAAAGLAAARTLVPTSAPFSAAASSSGTGLRERGGRAAGERRRRARAADRRVAGGAVGVPARIGGDELDARSGELGLDPAAEGEAVRGERRDRGAARVRPPARRAERDVDLDARGRARERSAAAAACGIPTTGTSRRSSRPSAPAGTSAVDEDRRRAGEDGLARLVGRARTRARAAPRGRRRGCSPRSSK